MQLLYDTWNCKRLRAFNILQLTCFWSVSCFKAYIECQSSCWWSIWLNENFTNDGIFCAIYSNLVYIINESSKRFFVPSRSTIHIFKEIKSLEASFCFVWKVLLVTLNPGHWAVCNCDRLQPKLGFHDNYNEWAVKSFGSKQNEVENYKLRSKLRASPLVWSINSWSGELLTTSKWKFTAVKALWS